jgi:hypothetical protein
LTEGSLRLGEIAMDSGAAEFATMQVGGVVIPDGTDVVRA